MASLLMFFKHEIHLVALGEHGIHLVGIPLLAVGEHGIHLVAVEETGLHLVTVGDLPMKWNCLDSPAYIDPSLIILKC